MILAIVIIFLNRIISTDKRKRNSTSKPNSKHLHFMNNRNDKNNSGNDNKVNDKSLERLGNISNCVFYVNHSLNHKYSPCKIPLISNDSKLNNKLDFVNNIHSVFPNTNLEVKSSQNFRFSSQTDSDSKVDKKELVQKYNVTNIEILQTPTEKEGNFKARHCEIIINYIKIVLSRYDILYIYENNAYKNSNDQIGLIHEYNQNHVNWANILSDPKFIDRNTIFFKLILGRCTQNELERRNMFSILKNQSLDYDKSQILLLESYRINEIKYEENVYEMNNLIKLKILNNVYIKKRDQSNQIFDDYNNKLSEFIQNQININKELQMMHIETNLNIQKWEKESLSHIFIINKYREEMLEKYFPLLLKYNNNLLVHSKNKLGILNTYDAILKQEIDYLYSLIMEISSQF